MNEMNIPASMHNLTQMDRIQQNQHNAPISNQAQNAEKAKEEAARRIDMPVEPDQVEGKIINPDDKKEGNFQKGKKKKKKNKKQQLDMEGDTGRFIDFSA